MNICDDFGRPGFLPPPPFPFPLHKLSVLRAVRADPRVVRYASRPASLRAYSARHAAHVLYRTKTNY